MTQRLARVAQSPLVHVLGTAAFPVVFLWAHNTSERIAPMTPLRPLMVIWACALAVFLLIRAILRDPLRAGLLTSLLIAAFFTFGRIREFVDPFGTGFDDRRLIVLFVLVLFIGGTLALRAGRIAKGATQALNLVASVLVLLNVTQIVISAGGPGGPSPPHGSTFRLPGVEEGATRPRRDVYYLIFDRYPNVRTLREDFGFDDQPFLDFLRSHGFFVADESLANYPKTVHSLASSLNMTYLDDLAARVGPGSDDWSPLLASLQGSNVATAFHDLGYRYEHVGSWFDPTRIDPAADHNNDYGAVSEFSGVLLETTMWPTLATSLGIDASFERRHYETALFQFRAVERIARDPAPTFTFAHFLLPHPPFVFDSRGRYLAPGDVERMGIEKAYLEQLRYTNRRIRELVLDLLSQPERSRPIIVIQSDEGPHFRRLVEDEAHFVWPDASDAELGRKLRILNAYYLPGEGEPPYETISPVNTFRLILSRYFGADLPLYEDRAYVYRDASHPYLFTDVTSRLRR